MVLGDADGVVTTGYDVTRVDAGGGLTGQQPGAVRVTGALHTSGGAHTANKVGVTISAPGALTLVASILIDTSKMIINALINSNLSSMILITWHWDHMDFQHIHPHQYSLGWGLLQNQSYTDTWEGWWGNSQR